VPIGHAVNANFCMVSSFGVHRDADVARARFTEGFRFFQFALAWHYGFGEHYPGRTNIWEKFQLAQRHMPMNDFAEAGISDPAGVREHVRKFQAAGIDQLGFVLQGGRNRHEHICEALELFAGEVMDEFHAGEAERVARKAEALTPYIEVAFKRKQDGMKPLLDADIPPVMALGRPISQKPKEPQPVDGPKKISWRDALRMGEAELAATGAPAADDVAAASRGGR
jgi:hypothetical protein